MAIPDFQTLMLPLLELLKDRTVIKLSEMVDIMSDKYNLTKEERNEWLPSKVQKTMYNRVAWAKQYLKNSDLIESPEKGSFKITQKGLDVLKEHQVPALFFVTGHFMEQNPELVKRMADEGHIVGNHTWHHPDLAKVNKEKFNEELQLVEDKYKEITGQEMVRYLRPPEGHFNQQMLDWAKERGYYTILWSLAYMDWDVNKQKGADYAYNQILARMHPGAIVLMHSISSDNAECLNKLIPELRNEGYEFKSLQYLMTQDSPVIIE